MLIAMMAQTFDKIAGDSAIRYQLLSSHTTMSIANQPATSPPLSLLSVPYNVIRVITKSFKGTATELVEESSTSPARERAEGDGKGKKRRQSHERLQGGERAAKAMFQVRQVMDVMIHRCSHTYVPACVHAYVFQVRQVMDVMIANIEGLAEKDDMRRRGLRDQALRSKLSTLEQQLGKLEKLPRIMQSIQEKLEKQSEQLPPVPAPSIDAGQAAVAVEMQTMPSEATTPMDPPPPPPPPLSPSQDMLAPSSPPQRVNEQVRGHLQANKSLAEHINVVRI